MYIIRIRAVPSRRRRMKTQSKTRLIFMKLWLNKMISQNSIPRKITIHFHLRSRKKKIQRKHTVIRKDDASLVPVVAVIRMLLIHQPPLNVFIPLKTTILKSMKSKWIKLRKRRPKTMGTFWPKKAIQRFTHIISDKWDQYFPKKGKCSKVIMRVVTQHNRKRKKYSIRKTIRLVRHIKHRRTTAIPK